MASSHFFGTCKSSTCQFYLVVAWSGLWSVTSLGTSVDDSEVLFDGAVAVDTSLESVQHSVSFDELAKDSLVAIKVRGRAEGDRELRSTGVLSVVGQSEHAALDVSHSQVLVLKAQAKSTGVFLTKLASRDSETGHTVVERCADVRALATLAERAEALSSLRLSVSVQLEDKIAEFLVTIGNS